MRFGNPDIMQVFIDLPDRYDYAEFLRLCSERNLATDLSEREYAQYAGMALLAAKKYQNSTVYDAYMRFVTEESFDQRPAPVSAPVPTQQITEVVTTSTAPCGSCGGGRVR